ncbi:MAG TPA: hypothetical protein P5160_01235 [Candidatus Omnitrophota bacterium]|nr:hypothetical protein [Candidatus Omnitrophota bacterium]
MTKWVLVFLLAAWSAPACASEAVAVCQELTLEVQGRGFYEREIDSCDGIKNCHERPDGSFYYEVPDTRFKVIEAEGGAECPAKGSLLDISEEVSSDQIRASLVAITSMGPDGIVSGMMLDHIRPMDPQSPVKEVSLASVTHIVPCGKKDTTMGSGAYDACCEGLMAVGVFAEGETSCEERQLSGGYACAACGDGLCEGPYENSCSCVQDCPGQ